MRVLIVDDEVEIRSALRRALELEGYQVTEAGDGVEAEEVMRANPADLVIADIVMPRKQGIEFVSELHKDHPETKIIVISGGARIAQQDNLDFLLSVAEGAGAAKTLAKPFDLDVMMETVNSLLQPNH